jgi:hypothetical protein
MSNITGMCLCENVKYEILGMLGPIFNCHCSKCRRWHGAAFRTRASIEISQFKLISGHDSLSTYESSSNVTKHFCKNCGSPLHSTYKDRPNVIGIPVGPLVGVPNKPEANIFVGSKASWYEITDNLPQYESWPETESTVRKTNR